MKLLERLARIEVHESAPFSEWLRLACNQLSWGTTIVAITPTGDEKTCGALHQLVRAGHNPVLIVVEPFTEIRQIRDRARSLGFQAYKVSRKEDLAKWRISKRAGRIRV